MPYVRWPVAVLFIASATIAIRDTYYLQLVLQAVLPGKTLPMSPYEAWQDSILFGNAFTIYGYKSYGKLAQKVFLEMVPIIITTLPGVWLSTSRAAKYYFS